MVPMAKQQLHVQIQSMAKAREERGPSYALAGLKSSEQSFQQAVGKTYAQLAAEVDTLAGDSDEAARTRHALLQKRLPTLSWLLEMHDDAHRNLEKADAAYQVAIASQVVYTPEQRAAADTLADAIYRLRTAGQDVTGDGSQQSQVLRDGLRIGKGFRRENPHEVRAEANALLLSLQGPPDDEQGVAAEADRARSTALCDGLEERGVYLEAFVPSVTKANDTLFKELESDLGSNKSAKRAALNMAQLELEQINARILASVNALSGVAARNALRELLPKTSDGRSDPGEPGPVITREPPAAPVVDVDLARPTPDAKA